MIKRLLCFVLLVTPLFAWADYSPTVTYEDEYKTSEDPAYLCNLRKRGAWIKANITNAGYPLRAAGAICTLTDVNNATASIDIPWSAKCPYGGVLNASKTSCVGGNPPEPCYPGTGPNITVTTGYYNGSSAGSAIVKKIVPDGGLTTTPYCSGGCTVQLTGKGAGNEQTLPSGLVKATFTGETVSTGGSCTASPDNDGSGGSPPPADSNTGTGKCPSGSSPSGQDSSGHTMCKSDTPPQSPPKVSQEKPPVTTTNPDGSKTTKTETSTTNADGSTTTIIKETTTKTDGSTATTVSGSTKKPDGSAGVPDKPENDMCKLNPNLTVCKNSQVMGACEAVTCEGDAIQCATLRAASAMECRQKDDKKILEESSAYGLGKQVASGTDPMGSQLPGPGKASLVTMPSSLDASGWLGGGSLPADKTFSYQGKSFTIPLSKWLAYMIVLRYALMIMALLSAFKILSGAIIRE